MGKPKPAEKEPQYVTTEMFNKFAESVMKALEKPEATRPVASEPEVKEREVAAEDEQMQVAPSWQAKAREILGDALDHCELSMPAHGGTLFTIVIKLSHSNAPKDYLERYKQDRRTREIGNGGIGAVEEWCKLIKTNLQRK